MAFSEAAAQPQDRQNRRRPFSTWMKKLTHFKGSSTTDSNQPANSKRNTYQMRSQSKRNPPSKNNNPYPESGRINGLASVPANENGTHHNTSTEHTISSSYLDQGGESVQISDDEAPPPTIGNKSTAATMSTDMALSEAAQSHAASSGGATLATTGYGVSTGGRGEGSTFSSPAPSVRSLTTTLTTIHSAVPPNGQPSQDNQNSNSAHNVQFSHQFPAYPPATALPAHLAPLGGGGHPATYSTVTANNLLTDNASILTLASSSKRRRRRSMDTDASVRALAPSSLFGGSRESLPLSVLSSNIESSTAVVPHQTRPSVGGLNERNSIYSATGVAPALPSERNSYYAGKQSAAQDGASVISGLPGHGRNDSIPGSIGTPLTPSSPLASAHNPLSNAGKLSKSSSTWADLGESKKAGLDVDGQHEADKPDEPQQD